MKILHTADWHLGLSTEGVSRKTEQALILDDICEIADKKQIDIVLICGDVFCGISTPAYADEMFTNTLLKLSKNGDRAVVVVAGNNDQTERFTASQNFALFHNIFILNSLSTDFDVNQLPKNSRIKLVNNGRGFLEFANGDDIVVVSFLPYPSTFFASERTLPNETLIDKTKRLIDLGASAFSENKFNVFTSHFFVPYGNVEKDYYYEFSTDILPRKADYVALGHVHNFIEVDKTKNIYYSGAIIQNFENENEKKYVIVVETENNKLKTKQFTPLLKTKKIVSIDAESVDELRLKLAKLDNALVKIKIKQEIISSFDIKKLREEFPFIISFVLISKTKKAELNFIQDKPSEVQLLEKFFEKVYAKKPTKELVECFVEGLKTKENQNETN